MAGSRRGMAKERFEQAGVLPPAGCEQERDELVADQAYSASCRGSHAGACTLLKRGIGHNGVSGLTLVVGNHYRIEVGDDFHASTLMRRLRSLR